MKGWWNKCSLAEKRVWIARKGSVEARNIEGHPDVKEQREDIKLTVWWEGKYSIVVVCHLFYETQHL